MMRLALGLLSLLLPAPAQSADCQTVRFDGARFTICEVDLTQDTLRLWLNDRNGVPLGSFTNVNRLLAAQGKELGIAMNAGMYHADRSPVGHYVEDGQETMRVITSDGPGNFGLLPNGVLCLGDGTARVIESRRYASDRPECTHATQSGPMLVIDGDLHPRFLENSDSTYIRNGVGVSADGKTAWLAISEDRVNFHHFGRLFRDAIGARDALYFDGNISRLYDSGTGRNDFGLPMGPIIGTVRQAG
ncbi:phosphodiester glycosidase family protein [Maribius pontilimi]|uniref:Phosphodiester glycosidase family protein n=1 Tax=Palleronia pontilimi TaxID=1964209 RepID=A0A934MDP3_9RHOB|nr:phosphodiester glycosidase family protein [Palleronia pontilimi]MBJ3764133.1 phosphodiester glycosidase family protein [Palleronia pontilimi]